MIDVKVTPELLAALAWVAGRPEAKEPPALVVLDLMVEYDTPLARSVAMPVGGRARDMFELTAAGRRLLDQHSPAIAGWSVAQVKSLGDGKHWRTTRMSGKRHHFAGRTGDPLVSACGDWKLPSSWRLVSWQALDGEHVARLDCLRCRRELVRAGQ